MAYNVVKSKLEAHGGLCAIGGALLGQDGCSRIPSAADIEVNLHCRRVLTSGLTSKMASGVLLHHISVVDDSMITSLNVSIVRMKKIGEQVAQVAKLMNWHGLLVLRVRLLRSSDHQGGKQHRLIILASFFAEGVIDAPTLPSKKRELKRLLRNGLGVPGLTMEAVDPSNIDHLIECVTDQLEQVHELRKDKGSGKMLLQPSSKPAPPEALMRLVEVASQVDYDLTIIPIGKDARPTAKAARATMASFQSGRVEGLILPPDFDVFEFWAQVNTARGTGKVPVRFDYPSRMCAIPRRAKIGKRSKLGEGVKRKRGPAGTRRLPESRDGM